MTDSLTKIKAPVKNELKVFNEFFYKNLQSQIPLLNRVLKYIIKKKGKQMRPLFVILSAGIFGKINDKTYRGASFIELIHTATLVHDDVVDDSTQRRGAFTLNALWKNKISVLSGDYLLSKGMLMALENKENDMLELSSNTVKMMSEGELLQIEKARTLDINEEVYFEIIKMKTASLISSSFAIGVASTGATNDEIEKMSKAGEFAGIAFQIKDDILDFSTDITGKPKGVDIKEKKLTLPLIYALKIASGKEKKTIVKAISKRGKKKEVFDEVVSFIKEKKGFEYSENKMNEYIHKSLKIIDEFPDSKYKKSLCDLIRFSVSRKK